MSDEQAEPMAAVSAVPPPSFVVDLDGYEGPIDVLLTLARDQKVDLRQVSIVALADQYLAFIAAVRNANLELVAEYLVMAAWLAYLKSRLLLPEPPTADEPSATEMSAALAFQLRRLEAMREAGARLLARPQLGSEFFARGDREENGERIREVVTVGLFDLLEAYCAHLHRRRPQMLRIEAAELYSVDDAIHWLQRALGRSPNWESLWNLLPAGTLDGLRQGRLSARSALAASFAASLELAREGRVRLRQGSPFGPIYLSAAGGIRDPS
jgi:segregation and condensation protein A